jgi:hypothetical protein
MKHEKILGWGFLAFLVALSAGAETAASGITIVLGRPADRSIAVSVLADQAMDGYLEYGMASGQYSLSTAATSLPSGRPVEFELAGLQPNSRYFYRLRYKSAADGTFQADTEASFRTQRAPGQSFAFALQADSHPERGNTMFNADLYVRTLQLVAADQPDFYLTLGDDFSVDNLTTTNASTVAALYARQRNWLAGVGRGTPLFLVNGNHEQGAAYLLNGTPDNVAVYAQTARNLYFPQPGPDLFYTGDETPVEHIGLLRDYYAWTWGDALFVVIDPYWHSPVAVDSVYGGGDKTKDPWAITHGEAQYRWLKGTLEGSTARYKFVFAHHVNGRGRGGVEVAKEYEWGGSNDKGVYEFDTKRPGWGLPIHQLLARNKVTVFFQGHDHIFARQSLDGVTYQECPIPADYTYTAFNEDAYTSGVKYPNAGYLRVTVSPADVLVQYVRAFLPADETGGRKNGEIAYSYSVNQRLKGGKIGR